MNIFVAGATGILGRNVVPRLVAKGHFVRALSRSAQNEKLIRQLGAEPAAGDLFDMPALARVVEGSEAVLHLATKIPNKIRPSLRDFSENDRLRTEGTAKLLEAARKAGARLYLQQSIAFLAATRDARVLRDDAPCTLPMPPGSPFFAAAKMEELVRRANEDHGLATIILRGGLFYHAESLQIRQLLDAIRKRRLPIFGSGNNVISVIHVDDMGSAFVAALERPAPGATFFVVDDHPLAFKDYVNTTAALLGAKPARHWPQFLARSLLGPVTGVLPTISFNCPNTKLKQATGWQPEYPDLSAGMKQVLGRVRLYS
jgi:nucleoside-diphosphate-sugar epimerase